MSKVFSAVIIILFVNILLAFLLTAIGQTVGTYDTFDVGSYNESGYPSESEGQLGVLNMLWNAATFNIEGIPSGVQVLVFGTLNTIMGVSILFLLRGVG